MTNSSSYPQEVALSAKESLLYNAGAKSNKTSEEVSVTLESAGDTLRLAFWHFTNNEWQIIFEDTKAEHTADWATVYAFLQLVEESSQYDTWVHKGDDTDMQHRIIGLSMLKTQVENALTGS